MRERVVKALPVRSDYLPPFIEQLVLAIGIIVFHWSFTEMAFLYVSEIVVINILFPAIALFVAEPVETLDNDRLHGEPQTLQPFQWFPPTILPESQIGGKILPLCVRVRDLHPPELGCPDWHSLISYCLNIGCNRRHLCLPTDTCLPRVRDRSAVSEAVGGRSTQIRRNATCRTCSDTFGCDSSSDSYSRGWYLCNRY